jgi:hypothetical protein
MMYQVRQSVVKYALKIAFIDKEEKARPEIEIIDNAALRIESNFIAI